jgi:VPDSG-CTERM motif
MKTLKYALLAFGLFALNAANVQANTIFDFTFSDSGGNVGSGMLSATAQGGGSFLAVSGNLLVTGGSAAGTYALSPGPSVAFIFDNLLFPSGNPLVDNGGLLFKSAGLEINIYSTGPDDYHFDFFDGTVDNLGPSGGLFTLTAAVPDTGSTVSLLGLASLGLVALRRKLRC